ncbi:hypothetical protein TSAR_000560 [Trichomalopsis sarcophagae]|uniref:Major facilitator superfamily (MFS) profile domain-containing protein n=1 Tax=Trichomalopsis sarcophagae TaxID=543379 RepID=A0A232F7E4_9HYME|nr:hypothetical protein TSAR_000560 [Trichomalopsis sarcophagae]
MTNDAGLAIDGYFGAILIGVTRLFGTIVITSISKKFGRPIPSIASGIGMATSMLTLSMYLFLKSENIVIQDSGIIPAVCIMMYIFMSTIGFLTIPFAMIGEIYTISVKDILSGITTCLAYIINFITVKMYPYMILIMDQQGIFLFYAVASFIGTLKNRTDSDNTELNKEITTPLSSRFNNK